MARKTRKFSEDVPFSLTSMMDMMTIILVFMIKNLDAEGQLLTQAENLILPVSTSKVQPKEVALSWSITTMSWSIMPRSFRPKTS